MSRNYDHPGGESSGSGHYGGYEHSAHPHAEAAGFPAAAPGGYGLPPPGMVPPPVMGYGAYSGPAAGGYGRQAIPMFDMASAYSHHHHHYDPHGMMGSGAPQQIPHPDDDDAEERGSPSTAEPSAAALPPKKHLRKAAGEIWSDPTLADWPEDDFRVFCGDLGNEVTDEVLANAFRKFKSFQKARVIRDKKTGKSRGYGFVSFKDPEDMLASLKEMNRKYVGNRPIRVTVSKWKDREVGSEKNKKLNAILKTQATASKSLKKFKKLKPVTGGKKALKAGTEAPRPRFPKAYQGPRPPPFGGFGHIARQRNQQLQQHAAASSSSGGA